LEDLSGTGQADPFPDGYKIQNKKKANIPAGPLTINYGSSKNYLLLNVSHKNKKSQLP
jgi:hypothetical protein